MIRPVKLTLRQLELFWSAARSGSFSGAAAMQFVTPSAVAVAVTQLEQVIGGPLLVRRPAHGVTVTPLGRRVAERAQEIILGAHELQFLRDEDSDGFAGTVAVGLHVTLAPLITPVLYGTFAELHPEADVSFVDGTTEQLSAPLNRGELDFVVGYQFGLPPDMENYALSNTQAVVMLPRNHRLAQHAELILSQLIGESMVLLDVEPTADRVLDMLRGTGNDPIVTYRASSLDLVKTLVAQGLGISILLSNPLSNAIHDSSELVSIPLTDLTAQVPVSAYWLRDIALSPLASQLVELLRNTLDPQAP